MLRVLTELFKFHFVACIVIESLGFCCHRFPFFLNTFIKSVPHCIMMRLSNAECINMRPHSHSPVHAGHLTASAVFIYLVIYHSLYWIPTVSKLCAERFIWIYPLMLYATPEMRILYLHGRRRKLGLGRLSDLPENPKLVYYADLNSKRNILLLSLKRLMY